MTDTNTTPKYVATIGNEIGILTDEEYTIMLCMHQITMSERERVSMIPDEELDAKLKEDYTIYCHLSKERKTYERSLFVVTKSDSMMKYIPKEHWDYQLYKTQLEASVDTFYLIPEKFMTDEIKEIQAKHIKEYEDMVVNNDTFTELDWIPDACRTQIVLDTIENRCKQM
jgi:hypothetical protein